MPIRQSIDPNLTPRERAELDWEKEATQLQVEYGIKQKELELQIKKTEVHWGQVLRLPLTIVLLPVKLLAVAAIIAAAITKYELPDAFWEFLKG